MTASRHIAIALGALRSALMTLERGEIDRAVRALDDAIFAAGQARAELGSPPPTEPLATAPQEQRP